MPRKRLELKLTSFEKKKLEILALEPGMSVRCNVILLTERGLPLQLIADTLGISKTTVNTWRQIFLARRVAGLIDRPSPGRPPKSKRKLRQQGHHLVVGATVASSR